MKTSLDFPDLTDDEITHSEQLIEKIIVAMNGGVISFADYMHMALYEPGLGYYAAGATKIGEAGDFVTAPEISALFGQCLANSISQSFEQGKEANVLEFGAGTGKLCLDIINSLNASNTTWKSYQILETSADLIQRQKQFLVNNLLEKNLDKITWIHQVPHEFNGVVIGNEVMDAMPVNIVIKQQTWHELGVAFEKNKFTWKALEKESLAVDTMQLIEKNNHIDCELGYCTEINLQHKAWLNSLFDACGSVDVLLIDYGYFQSEYYHAERTTGTLMCYFRHRAHSDPLVLPGLQDITASVDFSALALAAEDCGFVVKDISSQTEFLIRNGLIELAEKQTASYQGSNKGVYEIKIAQQIKTLTLPAEMGEIFKVMSFFKN